MLFVGECHYDSKRSQHILQQYFVYEQRPEAATVISHFRDRQDNRATSDNPNDKRVNPLVAIPGSKGSGKSAFLVNFPDSKECQETFGNPIVSTLTFNSAMTLLGRPVFGLRIIFGALRGMTSLDMDFSTFVRRLKQDDVTAEEAVNLVWNFRVSSSDHLC